MGPSVPSSAFRGSDAHAPGEVAQDLASARELMRSVGYDRYIAFAGRQREERLFS
jgi:hypothetical protein